MRGGVALRARRHERRSTRAQRRGVRPPHGAAVSTPPAAARRTRSIAATVPSRRDSRAAAVPGVPAGLLKGATVPRLSVASRRSASTSTCLLHHPPGPGGPPPRPARPTGAGSSPSAARPARSTRPRRSACRVFALSNAYCTVPRTGTPCTFPVPASATRRLSNSTDRSPPVRFQSPAMRCTDASRSVAVTASPRPPTSSRRPAACQAAARLHRPTHLRGGDADRLREAHRLGIEYSEAAGQWTWTSASTASRGVAPASPDTRTAPRGIVRSVRRPWGHCELQAVGGKHGRPCNARGRRRPVACPDRLEHLQGLVGAPPQDACGAPTASNSSGDQPVPGRAAGGRREHVDRGELPASSTGL